MPLSAWIDAPGAIARRLSGAGFTEPWLVPSAVSFLASVLEPDWRVLELGAAPRLLGGLSGAVMY